MPDDLEYIVNGAMTMCKRGTAVLPFTTSVNTSVKIQNQQVGTEMDKTPLVNIPSFGMCAITNSPCTPIPTVWQHTYEFVKIKGCKPLVFKSCMLCEKGGKIKFVTSGQIPLKDCIDPETFETIKKANEASKEAVKEYELEKKSVGESGFFESFIPFWGSFRDAIHSFQTGHWGWGIFHTFMVGVDGVTLGVSSVGKGIAKNGLKGGAEALSKSLTKKMLAAAALKDAAVAAIKRGIKKIPELSIKHLGICIVKACFPEGTPVATRDGLKNIEDIQIGDEVWAYEEKTGKIGLKKVLSTFERKVHTIVELTIDGELIKTTPEHPFYVNGEWKEAGLLETNDSIMLFSGKLAKIEKIEHIIEGQLAYTEEINNKIQENKIIDDGFTVFNFEVGDWHTYFVGLKKILVHNTACLYALAKDGVKYAQNILKGIEFNKIMAKAGRLKGAVHEVYIKGLKTRLDSLISGKKIISRKATQLAEVSEETAKRYIDEIPKKYKQGTEVANPGRVGAPALEGDYVLQVPKQNKPVPSSVLEHAKNKGVTIDEVPDVTDDMLKTW